MHHTVMSKRLVRACSTLAFVRGPDVMSAQTRNLLSNAETDLLSGTIQFVLNMSSEV